MNEFLDDFAFNARDYLRLFFSPFVGAWQGFRAECKRSNAEYAARYGRSQTSGGAGPAQ
jgi:hypothetical protein